MVETRFMKREKKKKRAHRGGRGNCGHQKYPGRPTAEMIIKLADGGGSDSFVGDCTDGVPIRRNGSISFGDITFGAGS